MKLILASSSPRRRELLRLVTEKYTVCTSETEEQVAEGTAPWQAAVQLARRKAKAVVALHPDALVLGSDTVVDLDKHILGKPHTAERGRAMLKELSGRPHWVHTGVCLCAPGQLVRQEVSSTRVTFAPLDEAEIDWYLATGEGLDKAGGYGIQGLGARFVTAIEGDYYTVMGLPVRLVYQLLRPYLLELEKI